MFLSQYAMMIQLDMTLSKLLMGRHVVNHQNMIQEN